MSWIKSRWQTGVLLGLVVAAVAVPAWASSEGTGDVQQATGAPKGDSGQVVPAASRAPGRFPPPGTRDVLPLPPRPTREQLDQSLQCMSDHGFGMGAANGPGVFIPRSETKTREFRQAAKECELPRPPTHAQIDAQIARIGCSAAHARREGGD
jgi:hypothetical protein